MNAAVAKQPPAVAAKATRSFREREHRYSKMPVKDLLTIRMDELGLQNADLQVALDYPAPNVISMMKTGSMRLPENKVTEAADILQLDRAFLLRKVMLENNSRLWDVIDKVLGPKVVSANEQALLELLRKELDGHDVELTSHPEFIQAIAPILKSIAKREDELAKATLKRIRKIS